MEEKFLLEKHALVIEATRRYLVTNEPTGLSDEMFDKLEKAAKDDGFDVRGYVYAEIEGTKVPNAPYLTEINKVQVAGDMYEEVQKFYEEYMKDGDKSEPLFLLKYDGSSLVGYYNSVTGECMRVVTAGGFNRTSEGFDRTSKFRNFFPTLPKGTGICAIQAECLVALEHGFGERSRQKANGLVNSKFLEDEVEMYCNLRAFRYFQEPGSPVLNFTSVMNDLTPITKKCLVHGDWCPGFAGAWVMSWNDLMNLGPDVVNKDIWKTPTGTFLVDGIVAYTPEGECIKALKYRDAGRGESVEIESIKWNDQSLTTGKDSWSANAILATPIVIRGAEIKKPTVGSISKMVSNNISRGAKVTVILASSTIPQIDKVLEPGNGDFEWPTCKCGYTLTENDIFGAQAKCGNPECTYRLERMIDYLNSCQSMADVDLGLFLRLDRLDWFKKASDMPKLLQDITDVIVNNGSKEDLGVVLKSQFKFTKKQEANLNLVLWPAWKALRFKLLGRD